MCLAPTSSTAVTRPFHVLEGRVSVLGNAGCNHSRHHVLFLWLNQAICSSDGHPGSGLTIIPSWSYPAANRWCASGLWHHKIPSLVTPQLMALSHYKIRMSPHPSLLFPTAYGTKKAPFLEQGWRNEGQWLLPLHRRMRGLQLSL